MGNHALLRRKSWSAFLSALLVASSLFFQNSFNPSIESAQANGTCSAVGVTVTPLHGTRAYLDVKGTPDYQGMYIGYRVSTTSANLSVSVNDFAANNKAISKVLELGPKTFTNVTPSAPASAFFLVEARTPSTTAGVDTIVTVNYGSGTCTFLDSIVLSKKTIAANPNKIYSGAVGFPDGTAVGPGSTVYVKLTGNTGTIGAGPYGTREINLAPVANLADWDPNQWELKSVYFKSANTLCGANGVVRDRLFFSNTTNPSSLNCNGLYSLVYEFRAKTSGSYASRANNINAFAYIASGNLIKHTNPFSGTISLPTVQAGAAAVNETQAIDVVASETLTNSTPDFTANDLFATTDVGTAVTYSPLTFLGQSTPINWNSSCLVRPSYSSEAVNCDGPYSVREYDPEAESYTATVRGNFRLVTVGSEKRLVFTPAAGFTSTAGDELGIEFTAVDTSNPAKSTTATAFVTVTNSLIATPISLVTPQGQATTSGTVVGLNVTTAITEVCFLTPTCQTTYTLTGQGVWSVNGSSAPFTLTFTPDAGFTGTVTVDYQIKDSSNALAQSTATVEVFSVPSATLKNASTSMQTAATINPTVSGGSGPFSYCLATVGPVAVSCSTSTTQSANISWTVNSSGVVTATPIGNFVGTESVVFAVVDSRGQISTVSYTVQVTAPNPPTISETVGYASTSQALTLSPILTASSSYTLCIGTGSCVTTLNQAGVGTWTIVGNQIGFKSVNNFTGNATVSMRITDLAGQVASASQSVVVNAPAAPRAQDTSGTTFTTTPIVLNPQPTSILPLTPCFVSGASCVSSVVTSNFTWSFEAGKPKFEAAPGYTLQTLRMMRYTDTLGQSSPDVQLTVVITSVAPTPPSASAVAATSVTTNSATLRGSVNAGTNNSSVTICYGTASTLVGCTTQTATPGSVNAGSAASVSLAVSSLTPGTTYFYWVIAEDGVTSATSSSVSFETDQQLVVNNTPTQAPAPAPTGDTAPPAPPLCTASLNSGPELGLLGVIGRLFTSLFNFVNGGYQSAVSALSETSFVKTLAASTPKGGAKLDPATVEIKSGTTEGEVTVTSKTGESLQLLDVTSTNLSIQSQFSGSDFNNPLTWQALGYGPKCWKLEPFGDTDYFYTLPNPIALPAGTAAGNWRYSNVMVKAGSITATSDTYQTDTIYPTPKPGDRVFADINGNGVFDPGGKTGDKAISHVIICITDAAITPSPAPSTQGSASPAVTSSPTVSPTATATPTPTPTPTQTVTPTPSPTQTVAPSPTPTTRPTASPTPTVTPTPTPTQTVAPSPTPTATPTPPVVLPENCVWPTPTVTPRIAEPTPTPSPTILLIVKPLSGPTPTPSATPTPSPTGTATPTPTPTGTATPTPTPTGTASPIPTPSPTPTGTATPTPAPTGTATPTPGNPDVPPVDPAPPSICQPSADYGVAMVISNGAATSCYRVTETYFRTFAFPSLFQVVVDATPTESPAALPAPGPDAEEVLADTGLDSALLMLLAMLLAGSGAMFLVAARRRV